MREDRRDDDPSPDAPRRDALATVRAWYDGIVAGDREVLHDLCAPEAEFVLADTFPDGGRYVGREAVFEEFLPAPSPWTAIRPEVDEYFVVTDERVVVQGRYVGRMRESGAAFDVRFAHLWRVRDGAIVYLQQYVDTARIRDAVAGRGPE